MDIVERLRDPNIIRHDGQFNLCDEAADEIERLRAENIALNNEMEEICAKEKTRFAELRAEVAALKAQVVMEPVMYANPPFDLRPLYSAAQLAQVQRERDEAIAEGRPLLLDAAGV